MLAKDKKNQKSKKITSALQPSEGVRTAQFFLKAIETAEYLEIKEHFLQQVFGNQRQTERKVD
jgi:hypothetical protein